MPRYIDNRGGGGGGGTGPQGPAGPTGPQGPAGTYTPPTPVVLTYAATVNTNAALSTLFDLTLTGNVTLANPTNGVDGVSVIWRIRQDATGNRILTLDTNFRIPSSASSPLVLSVAASKLDYLIAKYNSTDTKWDVVSFVTGY